MREHGESIYGTGAGLFNLIESYVSIHKENKVYIHDRNRPADGSPLKLPALKQTIHSSYLLAGGEVVVTQSEDAVIIDVPAVDR